MNKFLIVVFLSFITIICYAQDNAEFSADRPGVTTSPDIMPKYKLMWETGLAYENDRTEETSVKTLNYHNSLFRLGLSDYAELRFGFAANHTYLKNEDSYGGISSLLVGTKMKIFDGYNVIPKISFLGELLLPGKSGSNYLPPHIGANLHLAFSNDITSWFSVGYDAGLIWSGMPEEEHASTFLSINCNFKPTERLGLYVEECNFLNQKNLYVVEMGGTYMVSSRIQLDAYADVNLKHLGDYINIGLGVAWLIY